MKLPPNPFLRSFRVYLEDTDAGGHMYHANHLRFAERARSDLLHEFGICHRDEHGADRFFVVSDLTIKYCAPAFVGDEVTVITRIVQMTPVRVVFAQTLQRGGVCIAELRVTVVCINGRGAPVRLEQEFVRLCREWQVREQAQIED
ncbi:MAG: YbgC/FadM family acyl-CoA thioesterase [Holosporales bacterium]